SSAPRDSWRLPRLPRGHPRTPCSPGRPSPRSLHPPCRHPAGLGRPQRWRRQLLTADLHTVACASVRECPSTAASLEGLVQSNLGRGAGSLLISHAWSLLEI